MKGNRGRTDLAEGDLAREVGIEQRTRAETLENTERVDGVDL